MAAILDSDFRCARVPFPEDFSVRASDVVGVQGKRVGNFALLQFLVSKRGQGRRKGRVNRLQDVAFRPAAPPLRKAFEQLRIGRSPEYGAVAAVFFNFFHKLRQRSYRLTLDGIQRRGRVDSSEDL